MRLRDKVLPQVLRASPIGGSPAAHGSFKEVFEIITGETPPKCQRGLWTHNIFRAQTHR
jgi:hypothetical protein